MNNSRQASSLQNQLASPPTPLTRAAGRSARKTTKRISTIQSPSNKKGRIQSRMLRSIWSWKTWVHRPSTPLNSPPSWSSPQSCPASTTTTQWSRMKYVPIYPNPLTRVPRHSAVQSSILWPTLPTSPRNLSEYQEVNTRSRKKKLPSWFKRTTEDTEVDKILSWQLKLVLIRSSYSKWQHELAQKPNFWRVL